MSPWQTGYESASILDNPFWREYPRPAPPEDERAARQFVDGWVARIKEERCEKK